MGQGVYGGKEMKTYLLCLRNERKGKERNLRVVLALTGRNKGEDRGVSVAGRISICYNNSVLNCTLPMHVVVSLPWRKCNAILVCHSTKPEFTDVQTSSGVKWICQERGWGRVRRIRDINRSTAN